MGHTYAAVLTTYLNFSLIIMQLYTRIHVYVYLCKYLEEEVGNVIYQLKLIKIVTIHLLTW